ncbi:MAG: hypothetical protein AVDCRST_MAG88-1882, partial [uncultured Thermomicrobiales bacterium]
CGLPSFTCSAKSAEYFASPWRGRWSPCVEVSIRNGRASAI